MEVVMTTVKITKEHILQSTPDDCYDCAIAVAVRESSLCYDGELVQVEGDGTISIEFNINNEPHSVELKHINREQQVTIEDFIAWYDAEFPEYSDEDKDDFAESGEFTIYLER